MVCRRGISDSNTFLRLFIMPHTTSVHKCVGFKHCLFANHSTVVIKTSLWKYMTTASLCGWTLSCISTTFGEIKNGKLNNILLWDTCTYLWEFKVGGSTIDRLTNSDRASKLTPSTEQLRTTSKRYPWTVHTRLNKNTKTLPNSDSKTSKRTLLE